MPRVAPDDRPVFLEALADTSRYNLTQPSMAMSNKEGVAAHVRQWREISGGGRAGQTNLLFMGIGAVVGGIGGGSLGLSIPAALLGGFPPLLLTGVVGAVAGGYAARFCRAGSAYTDGMMRVFINERRSVIKPEVPTGQAEIWVSKALLAWRSHEWRWKDDKPFMWVMLPPRARLSLETARTAVVMTLAADPFPSQSAALYSQRSLNRLVSVNAVTFAAAQKAKTDPEHAVDRWMRLLPHLGPFGIEAVGVLLVIMTVG